MKPLRFRSYGTQIPKLGLTYHIDINHIKTLLLVQLNLNSRIKSCNDFMKRGFAAQFGERLKFLSLQQATRYFGIFTTAHRAVVPHFRFKTDLILYLNSSRAASSGEFKFKLTI